MRGGNLPRPYAGERTSHTIAFRYAFSHYSRFGFILQGGCDGLCVVPQCGVGKPAPLLFISAETPNGGPGAIPPPAGRTVERK